MDENEIKLKNNAILHKDNSLNRLDLSFLKHIESIWRRTYLILTGRLEEQFHSRFMLI